MYKLWWRTSDEEVPSYHFMLSPRDALNRHYDSLLTLKTHFHIRFPYVSCVSYSIKVKILELLKKKFQAIKMHLIQQYPERIQIDFEMAQTY